MVNYSSFEEDKFRRQVDKALATVATILDTTRNPRYAEELQEHVYEDKYALANLLTNTAIAGYMNVLERFGLDEQKLNQLLDIVHDEKRTVTLRFTSQDSCSFLQSKDVDVLSDRGEMEHKMEQTESTTSAMGALFGTEKKTVWASKVTKKQREYHWTVTWSYKIIAFGGNDPSKDPIILQSRNGSTTIVTTGSKESPLPQSTVHPVKDVNLTWLLQQISSDDKHVCKFQIDRSSSEKCKTPRRNENIDAAFAFFGEVDKWSAQCFHHLRTHVEERILNKHNPASSPETKTPSLRAVHADNVFCPILPLFEEPRDVAGTATREEDSKSLVALTTQQQSSPSHCLLSIGDIDKFLNEQIRQLDAAKEALSELFPANDKIVTVAEATLVLLWHHSNYLSFGFRSGIDYIEDMLRKQLVAAIGKQVQPKDFEDFIRFHGKKLFAPQYAPKPFCYAIRRPQHYPDGVLCIESASDKMEPIEATVNFMENGPSMFIPINAATAVEITGHRYLHGWIQHKFDSSAEQTRHSHSSNFHLTARARQFSSFLVIVGTIGGPAEFIPKDAIILQNKDEVIIPLLLEELPTAKEFKDAISSLSPEQQRFAKSFRGMQLESSVFGVCVVQLKPQLEVLLGLPPDALTKEIRLTQDLMSLFIDYQIPSDLLSFDGAPEAALTDKVAAVKEHCKAVLAVIDDAKKKQLEESKDRAKMNVYRQVGEIDDQQEIDAMSAAFEMRSEGFYGGLLGSAPKKSIAMTLPAVAAAPPSKAVTFGAAPKQMAKLYRRQLKMEASPPPELFASMLDDAAVSGEKFFPSRDDIGRADQLISSTAPCAIDFTAIPKLLDAKFDVYDIDSALRATIIKSDKYWKRLRQENLLSKARESMLNPHEIKSEKDKAFDLLDALSRSGSLPIACAELHVVVAVTHCFEKDVMATVIKDNVNPIEKVEKTMLLMASTIHGVEPQTLIEDQGHSARLTQTFPALFAPTESETHSNG